MGQRICYYVSPDITNEKGNFVPAIIKENERGYHLTDYDWGNDFSIAEKCMEKMNKRLGLTEDDVTNIIFSSMFKKFGRREAV